MKSLVCLVIFSISTALFAAPHAFSGAAEELEISNRVLIKVKGEPISVRDVVRDMDFVFFQQYPQWVEYPEARFQFYQENWKNFLRRAIDQQLILQDAEDRKITVTEGEVREQIQKTLGPNVVENLALLNLDLEEAYDATRKQLIVEKMVGFCVRSKAVAHIQPQLLRARYEAWKQQHPVEKTYVYRVLSFLDTPERSSMDQAKEVYLRLATDHQTLPDIAQLVSNSLALSPDYRRTEREISPAHQHVLDELQPGEWSGPIDRQGKVMLFYLENLEIPPCPTFAEKVDELKEAMFFEQYEACDREYREQLRKKYGLTERFVSDLLPETMAPFALR